LATLSLLETASGGGTALSGPLSRLQARRAPLAQWAPLARKALLALKALKENKESGYKVRKALLALKARKAPPLRAPDLYMSSTEL